MSTSRKKKRKGGSSKDPTSWFGRYLAQKTLRQAARNQHPHSGVATGLAALTTPLGPGAVLANEVTMNQLTLPDPDTAKKNLTDAEKTILKRTWPEQLMAGLKQSAGWGLASGLAGGLASAGVAKLKGQDIDLSDLAMWAAISGGVGGSVPTGSAAINKFIIDKLTTKKDRESAKETVSKHPHKTSILPFGDAIGAIKR